jgi:hypothetical protein
MGSAYWVPLGEPPVEGTAGDVIDFVAEPFWLPPEPADTGVTMAV